MIFLQCCVNKYRRILQRHSIRIIIFQGSNLPTFTSRFTKLLITFVEQTDRAKQAPPKGTDKLETNPV